MNRASPVEMRKSLVMVDELRKTGILFVPIPVLNTEDKDNLIHALDRRLEIIAAEVEESK
jgi:hypothetical protein